MDKAFLKNVAEMAKEAYEVTDSLQKENQELRKDLESTKANQTTKQAADSAETAVANLSDDARERIVDHIISAGQAKEASRDELLETLASQPDKLADYVEKLASSAQLQPVKRLGKVASDTQAEKSERPSDAFWDRNVLRRS